MDASFFKSVLVIAIVLPGIYCVVCGPRNFKCVKGDECVPKHAYCNIVQDCADGSDEAYCYYDDVAANGGCPSFWWSCNFGKKCIPANFKCDYEGDCFYNEDESLCGYRAKPKLSSWFLDSLKASTKKSYDVYRTAIALHLAEKRYFSQGNAIGKEVSKEVKLQLLTSLTSSMYIEKDELALSIHALMVTCKDPRNFYGFNLVAELRKHVNRNNSVPYDLLTLCNAEDTMTPLDAQRAVDAFYSKDMPFTTDNQAMALQALACIQSGSNFTLPGTDMASMAQELKSHQFQNGTFGDLRTTALVLQALIASESNVDDFNYVAALESILKLQRVDGSFGSLADSYYVMPLLSKASFLQINSSHCPLSTRNDSDYPEWNQVYNACVNYSVDVEDDVKVLEHRTVYVPAGASIYHLIEIVNQLQPNQKAQYHVVDGKPYLSSLYDVQEDLERRRFWYIFRSNFLELLNESKGIKQRKFLIEKSPVDVKVNDSDVVALVYRYLPK